MRIRVRVDERIVSVDDWYVTMDGHVATVWMHRDLAIRVQVEPRRLFGNGGQW